MIRLWHGIRWPVIALLAVIAIVLGFVGFDSYLDARGIARSLWDKVYLSLQLFPLQSGSLDPPVPWQLQTARLLAPLVAAYATISAFMALFREQMASVRVRWFAHGHVVVGGLGRTGHLLTQGFTGLDHDVVTIEKDAKNPAIGESRQGGATVLIGDAADRTNLARSRVDRARYLFAVSGDDGTNARVALHARDLVRHRRGAPLTCFIRILDDELAELLEAEIADRPTGTFRLELFNAAERGTPTFLEKHPPFDEEGKTPFGPPHLLVVGLGQMGSRLVVQAARRWWAIMGPNGSQLPVTVVDTNAVEHVKSLVQRHPHVEKACDFIPKPIDVDCAEFEQGEFLIDPEGRPVTRAYVCLGDDARGLAAAIRLRRRLRDQRVEVVVRTKEHGGLGTLLEDEAEGYEDLHAFALLDLTCRPEVAIMGRTESMAKAIHEDYVEQQRIAGHTPATKPNMGAWEELPEHIRESNRRQADDIPRKLRHIGCRIEPLSDWNPDTFAFTSQEIEELAEREHVRWMEERTEPWWKFWKRRRGKREYFVPFDQLPENVKELDRNATRGIPAVLAKAGYSVIRLRQEERGHGGETGN